MKKVQAAQPSLELGKTDLAEGDQRRRNGFPAAQGLYNPQFERDACGMGFVVDVQGRPSHTIIQQALTVLERLTHRGAKGAEANSGDGAGIMLQLPHQFLQQQAAQLGIHLPELGEYGVGMLFMPQDPVLRKRCEQVMARIIAEEGQKLLGWRTVPTCNKSLGETAVSGEPFIRQLFIQKQYLTQTDPLAWERKLFIIRRRAEKEIAPLVDDDTFYIPSLSGRTIVYKGQFLSEQLPEYYPDLSDPMLESALALVHSRFSTNTFPSWARAHPYRTVIHNGEINTIRGNVNWFKAREAHFASPLFSDELDKVLPIVDETGSDTGRLDNVLEFLVLAGRSLPETVMMMIPEPWHKHDQMSPEKRAFYEYHSHLMEPWDGPAAIGFTDGSVVGAVLDRNGLRPSRYVVTKDGRVIMASEVGVLEIDPANVAYKGRLEPGRMLLVDTSLGRIVGDEELKKQIAGERPYQNWLDDNRIRLADIPSVANLEQSETDIHLHTEDAVLQHQKAFGYTFEDLRMIIAPMARDGKEALGSMGDDTPLAVLSDKPQPLYSYFKQLFAQVTNPPLDAIREELVTSTETLLGSEGNLLNPQAASCRQISLPHPILTDDELAKLRHLEINDSRSGRAPDRAGKWLGEDTGHSKSSRAFQTAVLPILYKVKHGGDGLETALDRLFRAADDAIGSGANLLILSDLGISRDCAGMPALLATAGLHHHLIRQGTRTQVSLIVESGEPREVHHFATLLGYGADAINPYLAFATLRDLIRKQLLTDVPYHQAESKYVKAVVQGVIKILSKMGISTVQSYRGAQIFEALGLHTELVAKYFTGTPSRIQGSDIHLLAKEVQMRHEQAFPERPSGSSALPTGGKYQYREEGEYHLFNPVTVHRLQHAVRTNDYETYKKYAEDVNGRSHQFATLRGLLKLKKVAEPIPLEEVESVEAICRRFKTGAMSYGSISQEAHEALAVAMNRIGGKSNTGEGGEDPARYTPDKNGDSRNSAIKQVASGRFGVTSQYLTEAQEIQIKMAQGAKPGEGGQLPGRKVYPWIARVRYSTPGVGLISPPPHHDIYSIEDLAQLIFDLKNANPEARINVKLVSEVGVGTIAAGVAKGHADVILISGHDGGTGASPQTSIKHAGLPWELGVAETHQTLLLNGLRDRVVVETDGQLKTGRDVVMAALLGAEEYGFATAPLVTLGCIMMRVCHLNTCPVGVATQNPELRKKFTGDPQHVVNFMRFIAQDMREIMAELGFRTIDEMVGRTDRLEVSEAIDHWKLQGIDLTPVLYRPNKSENVGHLLANGRKRPQQHGLEETLDNLMLLDYCRPALENGESVEGEFTIGNQHRAVGTTLGSAITRRHGMAGLAEDTIWLTFNGSAGQSFGAFIPQGLTLELAGDANDYVGKGLSGGKLVIYPPKTATFAAEENIIIGNVALYGATGGAAFIRGVAGERFAVRNSGATAVVEGVGDHGCEYMTGGRVVILGQTGRNFAAGMSGGVAYVLDWDGRFHERCNQEMVDLEPVHSTADIEELEKLIYAHMEATRSDLAWKILCMWDNVVRHFVKVMPRDYKLMLQAFNQVAQNGTLVGDELAMAAFQARQRQLVKA
ncbi:glutamate synthase large subunit [Candidatus Leptofilum sp.]|uniref:glutamate synthase large subunit n=1 Tax=Candidatus Leptofilum sp. TaxID=3241576 RepID=UPI003B5ACCB2